MTRAIPSPVVTASTREWPVISPSGGGSRRIVWSPERSEALASASGSAPVEAGGAAAAIGEGGGDSGAAAAGTSSSRSSRK